ncbi:beta-1,3-galactosyl-O-glycosyl-glycoprotein beta-1,6-N-acetylglucosaminyltransferase-like [Tubulanus polymorphus]|uniref:beta-1,3-galactosyl-O-glycosyl-glycoprotein beta-1,6-N-acetylglucosaminyltransferase-like n=1 Tax=Tubulanus polymorphus TaxID=672921 RepID=UPI003DA375F6
MVLIICNSFRYAKAKRILCIILVLNIVLLLINSGLLYLIYEPSSDKGWVSKVLGFMIEKKKAANVENSHRTTKLYHDLSSLRSKRLEEFLHGWRKTPEICESFLRNGPNSLADARNYMISHPKKFIKDGEYAFIIEELGCQRFKEVLRYNTHPISQEEHDFPLAFGIVMYRDVEQLERLLRAIYQPQNFYCVHVDLKASNAIHAGVKAIASCFDNVIVPSNPVAVEWGHYTALKSHLICAEQLLLKSKKWKYFINLTGQEFPLLSNRHFVRVLKIFNGTNEIQGGLGQLEWDLDRWKYKWTYGRRGFTRTDIRKSVPPHNLKIEKGATHIIATRPFIDYCINNQIAKDYLAWLEDTFVPDEAFFSTLNHDKKICAPGGYYGDSSWKPFVARSVNWNGQCGGKKVRTVCVMGISDIAPMLRGNRKFLVNKLYHDFEYLALDCLEGYQRKLVLMSRRNDFKFDEYFYRNLPQVLCKECKICPNVLVR